MNMQIVTIGRGYVLLKSGQHVVRVSYACEPVRFWDLGRAEEKIDRADN